MNKTLLIFLLLVAAGLVGYFVVFPQYQDFEAKKTASLLAKKELDDNKIYKDQLKNLLDELHKYDDKLAIIDSALPSEASFPAVADFIQTAAKENKMELSKIGTISSVESKEYSRMKENSLSVTVMGYYPDFKNFLTAVENSSRMLNVESISFSYSTTNLWFTFDLLIKFYSY